MCVAYLRKNYRGEEYKIIEGSDSNVGSKGNLDIRKARSLRWKSRKSRQ